MQALNDLLELLDRITARILGDRLTPRARRIGCLVALIIIAVLLCLFLFWIFGGCTPAEAPEEPTQAPDAGETEEPITTEEPEEEEEVILEALSFIDDILDAWCCQSCQETGDDLPDFMDIAWVEVLPPVPGEIPCVFTVVLYFDRVEALSVPFYGGVEFWNPDGPMASLDDFWCFNNAGNISYNFALTPTGTLDLSAMGVGENEMWGPIPAYGYTGFVDANTIVLDIPCGAVEPSWPFFVTTTSAEFWPCDQVGQGPDGMPTFLLGQNWPLGSNMPPDPSRDLPGFLDGLGDVVPCEKYDPMAYDGRGDIDRVLFDFTEIDGTTFFQTHVWMSEPGDEARDRAVIFDFHGAESFSLGYSFLEGSEHGGLIDQSTGGWMDSGSFGTFDPVTGKYTLGAPVGSLPTIAPLDFSGSSILQYEKGGPRFCDSVESLFADGFESGDTSAWSSSVP